MNADIPKVAAAKTEATPAAAKTKPAKEVAAVKAVVKTEKKPAAPAKKAPVVKKVKKEAKVKVVRDSFTMPQSEYQKIADIKAACLKTGMHVKKSEILRAGLQALATLSVPQLKVAIDKLDKIATGRPKKH